MADDAPVPHHPYERVQRYSGVVLLAIGLALAVATIVLSDDRLRAIAVGAAACVVGGIAFQLLNRATVRLDRAERVEDVPVAPPHATARRALVPLAVAGTLFTGLALALLGDGDDAPLFPWLALAFAIDRLTEAWRVRRWEAGHAVTLLISPRASWFTSRDLVALPASGARSPDIPAGA